MTNTFDDGCQLEVPINTVPKSDDVIIQKNVVRSKKESRIKPLVFNNIPSFASPKPTERDYDN